MYDPHTYPRFIPHGMGNSDFRCDTATMLAEEAEGN